jgi:hypothetical protein
VASSLGKLSDFWNAESLCHSALNSFCCVELELILSGSLNLLLTCACQLVGSGINADPFCLSQVQQKMRSKTKGGEITLCRSIREQWDQRRSFLFVAGSTEGAEQSQR